MGSRPQPREAKVRWRFTIEEARIKLEKVYPVMDALDEGEAEAEEKKGDTLK